MPREMISLAPVMVQDAPTAGGEEITHASTVDSGRFEARRDSTSARAGGTLIGADGAPADLSLATSVRLRFATAAGVELWVRDVGIVDAPTGRIAYLRLIVVEARL